MLLLNRAINLALINISGFIPLFFINALRWLDNYINDSLRSLQHEFSISVFLVFMLISLLYGIIHSAGPGHGKTIITTFFLKEKHPIAKAAMISGIVSLVHTGFSIILAVLFTTILSGIKGFFRIKIQSYFIVASGILIIIIGVFFLLLKIIFKEKDAVYNKNRNIFLIGIAAGSVPCPVALIIMLFALSNNIIFLGLASVISISLGMFFLLTAIGILSIKLRDGILFLSNKYIEKIGLIGELLEYISVILIIIIGLLMISSIIIK